MGECATCGTKFQRVKPWQIFCSTPCKSSTTNTRKRPDATVKRCRRCQENLPVDRFQMNHRSCISCEDLELAGLKRCSACREVKACEDFYMRSSRTGARDYQCKTCRSAASKARNANPAQKLLSRDVSYRNKYGIGVVEVEAMFARQSGCCAICKEPQRASRLHVDHDHKTGRIRALLCLKCNSMLGLCSERTEILKSAISYLERYSDGQDIRPRAATGHQ